MAIRSKAVKAFQVFDVVFLSLLGVLFAVPYLFIIVGAFTAESAFLAHGYTLLPAKLSFDAFRQVFATGSDIVSSLGSSVLITVCGTTVQVCITTLTAYALSKRKLKGKRVLMVILLFSMLFSGGLVPSYIWIAGKLQLRNNYLAVILPGALNSWNCLLTMNYLKSIPYEMEEAAKLDGCGCWRMFVKIYLPVAVPIVATITLFAAVQYWNMWAEPTLYFDSAHRGMLPLTALLREIISEDISPSGGNVRGVDETVKMATTVVATLPIICVYPFLQKYFMTGLMLGSVKG